MLEVSPLVPYMRYCRVVFFAEERVVSRGQSYRWTWEGEEYTWPPVGGYCEENQPTFAPQPKVGFCFKGFEEPSVIGIWKNEESHKQGKCSEYSSPWPWSGPETCNFNLPEGDWDYADFDVFGGVCGSHWFSIPVKRTDSCQSKNARL